MMTLKLPSKKLLTVFLKLNKKLKKQDKKLPTDQGKGKETKSSIPEPLVLRRQIKKSAKVKTHKSF